MRTQRMLVASLATLTLAGPGCAYVATGAIVGGLTVGGYYLMKKEAKDQWQRDLASAPTIANPARTGTAHPVLGLSDGGTKVTLQSYSSEGTCFQWTVGDSAADVQALRYQLASYRTENPEEKGFAVAAASVNILDEKRDVVPVEVEKQDVTRDAEGHVIATTSHQEQELQTVFTTQAELCFPTGAVPARDTKYMVLHVQSPQQPTGDVERAFWRLK